MPNPWSLVSGYRKNAAVGASLLAKVVREQARSHRGSKPDGLIPKSF